MADLSGELMKQAGLFEYWARLAEEADSAYTWAKLHYEAIYIEILSQKRDGYRMCGEKTTKGWLEAEAKMDPSVSEAKKAVLRAQKTARLAKIAPRAMEQKMSTLMILGSIEKARIGSTGDASIRMPEHFSTNSYMGSYSKQNGPRFPSSEEYLKGREEDEEEDFDGDERLGQVDLGWGKKL